MDNAQSLVHRQTTAEKSAITAWGRLNGEGKRFRECRCLQKESRTQVFRLLDPDDPGAAIIAKRCRTSKAMVERLFYEEILTKMPSPRLRYHGLWQEENGSRCWLFLEDAGDGKYQVSLGQHRELAVQWLAALHVTTVRPEVAALLPDRGAGYYMNRLRSTRSTLLTILGTHAVNGVDADLLDAIVSQCDVLEHKWEAIEILCRELPPTPVHFDFEPKNLRVRTTLSECSLFVFDWDVAGFGPPVVDLAELTSSCRGHSDITGYWEILREHWPHIPVEHLQRLEDLGGILRLVKLLDWLSCSLAYELTEGNLSIEAAWPQKVLRKMNSLRTDMNAAMQNI